MVNMMATKEQERKALETIRKIVEQLSEGSYVRTAFDGCFEIAEENIEYDFADSMKARMESARESADTSEHTAETLYSENVRLKKQIERLEEQLDRELEWSAYEDDKNVSQFGYENLAHNAGTRCLDDEEAKNMLSEQFGFIKDRIEIVRNVPTYEINRHNQLRATGTAERNPLYNATDWNYIRFNCCGMAYELFNDELRFFA